MADVPGDGPFALPERWVHTQEPPSWKEIGRGPTAFVHWRRDRWPSLERLHALEQTIRADDTDALVVGLHGEIPKRTTKRVRDALLTRGAGAPTGLLEDGGDLGEQPGAITLVDEGALVDRFGPQTPIEQVAEALQALASEEGSPWRPRGDAPGPWPLAFPGDVAVSGSRVALVDTGHNRVLITRPGGDILHIVGDGVPAHRDGSLLEARFEAPRGVCWQGEELLVADTGNDAIRCVDPARDEVTTLARGSDGSLPSSLTRTGRGEIVVALAGTGGLRRLDEDGLAGLPGLDQDGIVHPVDIVAADRTLYVADLAGPGIVHLTEDGGSRSLGADAGLVEPAGLLVEDRLFVADAGRGQVFELSASGEGEGRGLLEAQAGPQAPSALDREADRFIVADGGGHHLWRLDPGVDQSIERVRLTESPLTLAEHIRLDPVEIAPGGRLELSVSYMLRGERGAPADVQAPIARGPVLDLGSEEGPIHEDGRIRVELTGRVAASGNLRLRWSLTREAIGHEAAWDLPIVVRPGAEERLRLALSTSPP